MKVGKKTVAIIAVAVIAALALSYGIGVLVVTFLRAGHGPVVGEYRAAELFEKAEAPRIAKPATVITTATTTMETGMEKLVKSPERMLIKTADLEIESDDPEAAANKIIALIEGYGGYVARLSISDRNGRSATMIVKVPEECFYEALNAIRKVGRVVREEVNVRDVTEQHIDLEARLRNLKAEEEWLLAAVEKAKTVQDLIMIEKELWRVRGEIERIEAQLKNLERMVTYSTISIWIKAPEKPKPPPSPYPEIDFTPVIAAAITALIYIAYGLVFLIIVGTPLAALAYLGYRVYRRAFRKKG